MSKEKKVTITLSPEMFHELRQIKKSLGWTWKGALIEGLKQK